MDCDCNVIVDGKCQCGTVHFSEDLPKTRLTFWRYLFYTQVVLGWALRILGFVVAIAMVGIEVIVLKRTDVIGSGVVCFGAFCVFEGLARLVTWSSPFDPLPTFDDYAN